MLSIEELEVKKVPLSVIKFDESNPNELTKEQMESLKLVMSKYGYLSPVILNKDFTVIDGEHRVRVYQELGKKEIQAYVIDVDTIDLKILRQLMNKLRGEHDKQKDALEFKTIFESNRLDEFSKLIAQPKEDFQRILENKFQIQFNKEENEIPEIPRETDVKTGDIYQLGRHRIMCGDCREDILEFMKNCNPKYTITDPPYNINFKYNIHKDKQNKSDYAEFMKKIFDNTPSTNIILTPGPKNLGIWYEIKEPDDIGTWVKRNSRSGASVFHFRRCEPIIFYGKFKKRNDDLFDFSMENYKELDIIETEVGVAENHAPAKPLKLWVCLITDFTEEKEIIFDPFLGSGTTLIACEQTNRVCYGMEIDPYYVDVIIKRWENYTGKKAVKSSS